MCRGSVWKLEEGRHGVANSTDRGLPVPEYGDEYADTLDGAEAADSWIESQTQFSRALAEWSEVPINIAGE